MHVALLTETTEWGGAEVFTVLLANELAKRGHQVTVVGLGHDVYKDADFGDPRRTRFLRLDCERLINKLDWSSLISLARKIPGDVSVFVKGHFLTGSWRFDLLMRLFFKRYIAIEQLTCEPLPEKTSRRYFHGLVSGLGVWWYRVWFYRFLRSIGPANIISVSELGRRRLVDDYRFPRSKVIAVPNGAEPKRFRPDPLGLSERCA